MRSITGNSEFTFALSQFRNLRTLKMNLNECVLKDCAIDPLKRLDKITDFSCSYSRDNAFNWVKALGSQQTMENINLTFSEFYGSHETLTLLNRFNNLKVLSINTHISGNRMLNAIGNLNELIELHLAFPHARFKWNEVVELVRRLPKLQKLLIKMSVQRFPFELKPYNNFVNIYCARGTKLIIEYQYEHNPFFEIIPPVNIPKSVLKVYADSSRFVEIQVKKT